MVRVEVGDSWIWTKVLDIQKVFRIHHYCIKSSSILLHKLVTRRNRANQIIHYDEFLFPTVLSTWPAIFCCLPLTTPTTIPIAFDCACGRFQTTETSTIFCHKRTFQSHLGHPRLLTETLHRNTIKPATGNGEDVAVNK